MKILVSNDDGVFAPGLSALAEAMGNFGEVLVVAPDRDRSAASNSLTLEVPLRVRPYPNGYYAVDGTPTDCVHLGLGEGFNFAADCVVSGLNAGANLGDDVLYSGTVAAATEGRFLGMPAIAFSMVGLHNQPITHYETGAWVAQKLIARMLQKPLAKNTILNVNIPDKPIDQIKTFSVVRLGRRHQSESVLEARDPRGRKIYWIGPAAEGEDSGPGTDFYAVEQGEVSITPLNLDLTHYKQMDIVHQWLDSNDALD